jgi:hypothetical protein
VVTNNFANLRDAGIASYDGAGTFNGRTIIQPAAGITVANGDGISGNPTLALSDDLAAVEGLSTTGIAVRTAVSTWTTRTITAGSGVSISNGDGVSGNPTISASAAVPTTFTADSGSATPALNNLNVLGSGSIATSASGSTVTTALTGLTNHAVLVGAGTSTITKVGPSATSGQILQSAGASADPAFSTATYPSTTTVSQILYSSATNVVSGLATANRAVLTTGATGVPVLTALATDGQLIIGSTAGVPAAATLTAGTGITITNGSNSISIAANGAIVAQTLTGDSGGALSPAAGNFNILGLSGSKTSGSGSTITVKSPPFSQVSGNGTSVLNTGEFVTATATRTLPASAGLADGDLFMYVCTTSNALTIQAVSAQKIRIGAQITSAAGTIVSTASGDSVSLRFNATDGFFYAVSLVGNWSFT